MACINVTPVTSGSVSVTPVGSSGVAINLSVPSSVAVALGTPTDIDATVADDYIDVFIDIGGSYCNPSVTELFYMRFEDGSQMYFEDGITPMIWEN